VGHRPDRAFPHYLLGLSLQRDADRVELEAQQHHRDALKALYSAETLATGWLNLAAARADSHEFLEDHSSAVRELASICRSKPGVSGGVYDYRLATALEKLPLSTSSDCRRAAHHFSIAGPLLRASGNIASAEYAEDRVRQCQNSH